MIVSITNLAIHTMIKMARTPAFAELNVTNSFQARFPTDSAIRSNESSSRRFASEMLPDGMVSPIAPRAMIFNSVGFSIENIMWDLSLVLRSSLL